MFGSHLSIAGGMVNALRDAARLRLDAVQVFTKNQKQWSCKPLDQAELKTWLDELNAMGWDSTRQSGAPARVVSHNSYLINLASPSAELWDKSLACQRIEIERCEELHIPLCVMHPGGHLGTARKAGAKSPNLLNGEINDEERAGLLRVVKGLDQIHRDLAGFKTITCLETTVGSGTHLGYSFEQLAFIREHVKQPERVGYCFDTCHVTAAGYDMTTDAKAGAVIERWDAICGAENLRVFHFNDSVGAIGSRLDRHAHIGFGTCGDSCFRTILNYPAWGTVPKVLETPKETDTKGVDWDIVNVRKLRKMIRTPPAPAPAPAAGKPGSKQGSVQEKQKKPLRSRRTTAASVEGSKR